MQGMLSSFVRTFFHHLIVGLRESLALGIGFSMVVFVSVLTRCRERRRNLFCKSLQDIYQLRKEPTGLTQRIRQEYRNENSNWGGECWTCWQFCVLLGLHVLLSKGCLAFLYSNGCLSHSHYHFSQTRKRLFLE